MLFVSATLETRAANIKDDECMRDQSHGRKPNDKKLNSGQATLTRDASLNQDSFIASAKEFLQIKENNWRASEKQWENLTEPDPVYGELDSAFAATMSDHYETLKMLVNANSTLDANQQALVKDMVFEVTRQSMAAEETHITGLRALRLLMLATFINSLHI